jgi:hypothetical protein
VSSLHHPELQRFGEVIRRDAIVSVEIGDRPARLSSRGRILARSSDSRLIAAPSTRATRAGSMAAVFRHQRGVNSEFVKTPTPACRAAWPGPGRHHARADGGGRFAARVSGTVHRAGRAGHLDRQIQTIASGPDSRSR